MHHRVASAVAVLLSTLAALAAVACSSAPESATSSLDNDVKGTDPVKGTDRGGNTSTDGGSDTSKPPTSTPTTPTPSGGECSAKADGDACFQCCVDKGDSAAYDAVDEIFRSCVCAATACATQCAASLCGETEAKPTADCLTCLNGKEEACITQAAAACKASAGCTAISACGASECSKFDKDEP